MEEPNRHPVLFALLPNKKKISYIRLFREIPKAVPELTTEKVTTDFQGAVCYQERVPFNRNKWFLLPQYEEIYLEKRLFSI